MTKARIALLGSAMALLLSGAASAQGYYDAPYNNAPGNNAPGNNAPAPYDRAYDDRVDPVSETVIVHPNDVIEERQMLGHIGGEVNPQAYNISRPVDFSDLDLHRGQDRAALHERIFQTASDLCAELDARVPGLAGDRDADRECVRDATRNAMRDVMDHVYD